MADGGRAYPAWSGWKGVKEGSKTLGDVVRAFNVTFEGSVIRRRPGRRIICTTVAGVKVTRIYEHVTISGSRQVIAALVSPNPTVAPRMGRIPVDGGTFDEITLPVFSQGTSPDSYFWSTSYKGGHSVVADPTGRLLDYDGATCALLVAKQGSDAAQLQTASRAYLLAPPPTDLALMWRNRIVSARGRTIGLSADPGDPTVPPDAPASGANVWPVDTNFDVLTQEGDEITGVAIQADRLVVFMRRGVVVVDEDSVSPIPRIADQQHGCVAPKSVQTIGGGRIAYLSDRSVCVFDGSRSVVVSDDVAETLALVNWHQASRAVSVHLSQKTEYRLWLPMIGRQGNRICVIWNYATNAWRVYGGFYPWCALALDTQPYDVTAAASILLPTGDEVCLTGDSQGRIWREDVGDDDQGTIFPAFFALAPVSNGAEVETFADWRIRAEFDGSYVTGLPLLHGNCLEQEIDRVVAAQATQSQSDTRRIYTHPAIADGLQAYGAPAWNQTQHTAEPRTQRLGSRGTSPSMQPLFLLPGQYGGQANPEPCAIHEIELALAPAGGRRG